MSPARLSACLLSLGFFFLFHETGPSAAWAKERGGSGGSAESIMENFTFHQKAENFPLSLSAGEMEALLDDLPCASELLKKYKIHSLTVSREGDGYAVDDGKGIKGTFTLLARDGAFRQYMGEGTIEKSLVGSISAEVVASIRYARVDTHLIRNDLEFWVLVKNPVIDVLCRLFNPLVKGVLRSNVEHLVLMVQQLAVAVRAYGEDVCAPQDARP